MPALHKEIDEIIEDLGTEIVGCKEQCQGVECNQDEGYYPRVFFLYPDDNSPMDLAVIGSNPGNAPPKELWLYRALGEGKKDGLTTYKDLREVWRKFPGAQEGTVFFRSYYSRLKDFLKPLESEGVISLDGILYSEVVFCESDSDIPPDTVTRCTGKFLKKKEMLELLSECRHVVCAGIEGAFEHVNRLPESDQWKVIGVYHPSGFGWINFVKYFVKGTRKLKKRIIEDLRAWEATQKPYQVKVTPNGTDPRPIRF